jgi:hypothetical protein
MRLGCRHRELDLMNENAMTKNNQTAGSSCASTLMQDNRMATMERSASEALDVKAEIARLAALSPIEYDRERKASALALGIRLETLGQADRFGWYGSGPIMSAPTLNFSKLANTASNLRSLLASKNWTSNPRLEKAARARARARFAFRERMRCALIESDPESQADIRRRMALALAGPDERAPESIKAKASDDPVWGADTLFGTL